MTNNKNHDPFSPKKRYDPEAYGPSGVCTPARPNNEIACPRNLADRPFEAPYELQQKQLPAGPGFYIVPYSMTARDMYDNLFKDQPNSALGKFGDLNTNLDGFLKGVTMISSAVSASVQTNESSYGCHSDALPRKAKTLSAIASGLSRNRTPPVVRPRSTANFMGPDNFPVRKIHILQMREMSQARILAIRHA